MKFLSSIFFIALTTLLGCTEQKKAGTSVYQQPAKAGEDSAATAAAATPAQPFVLMEMFTSEGCMNCPAAYPVVDKMVKTFSTQGEVYLLDYHVDYWNRGGWVDPFSREAFTFRQKKYAQAFKGAGLYTPQMVINGRTEFVASDPIREDKEIRQALATVPDYKLSLQLGGHKPNDSIPVTFNISPVPLGSILLVALVEHQVTNHVGAGENAGKTLTHFNVVRELTSLPLISKSGTVMVPPPNYDSTGQYQVIAFVQLPDNMHVIAADGVELNKEQAEK